MTSESTAANNGAETYGGDWSTVSRVVKFYRDGRDALDKEIEQNDIPEIRERVDRVHQRIRAFEEAKNIEVSSALKWNTGVGIFTHEVSRNIEKELLPLTSRWITVLPRPESLDAIPPMPCQPDDAALDQNAPFRAPDNTDEPHPNPPPGGTRVVALGQPPDIGSNEGQGDEGGGGEEPYSESSPGGINTVTPGQLPYTPSDEDEDGEDGGSDNEDESEYGQGSRRRKRQSARQHKKPSKKRQAVAPPATPPGINLSLLVRKIKKADVKDGERVFSINEIRGMFFVFRCGDALCPERICKKIPFGQDHAFNHMAKYHGIRQCEMDLFHAYAVQVEDADAEWRKQRAPSKTFNCSPKTYIPVEPSHQCEEAGQPSSTVPTAAQAQAGLHGDENNNDGNGQDRIYNGFAAPAQPASSARENMQPHDTNGPGYTASPFAADDILAGARNRMGHLGGESSAPRRPVARKQDKLPRRFAPKARDDDDDDDDGGRDSILSSSSCSTIQG